MADYGALFRADDGSLLVTSDTPCYELQGSYAPTSRSGNVNTYSVNASVFPLIVVACGPGNSAGVLAVEGGPGAWTVSVLSNVSCDILAFVPISGTSTTGYGLATFSASGQLLFDSNRKILNARQINNLSEGTSFSSTPGVNSVSYTSGPVKPSQSQSGEWVVVQDYVWVDTVYSCSYQQQYQCNYETVTTCGLQYVCTPQYQCFYDYATGGYQCGFFDSCGYQYVCTQVPEYVCKYVTVEVCGFTNVTNYATIYAYVVTTNWNIERGTASISLDGSSISFNWMLHKSGYYKQITQYTTTGYSGTTSGGLPAGYIPSPVFIENTEVYEGELNKNSTYPYTSDRANNITLGCITAIRSDYDN